MNIKDKFEKGFSNHTYRRVDGEYLVNIFLGYNEQGKMSMVITENGIISPIKSSKIINTSMRKRKDGKIALSFDLLDESYKALYLVFCKDMILVCEKAGSHMAISSALKRWKYWLEMFGRKRSEILNKMSIKGLIGELIELRDHFIPEYGELIAVKSWMGPLLGHKDFEIGSTWYEVKSISPGVAEIVISSLEQLDSDIDGHLSVVRLEETSPVNKTAITLNNLVMNIVDRIEDPDILELFRIRLDNMGYIQNEQYDSYAFLYKGTEYYGVKEGFPRILRKNVDDAIGRVKYTIHLNSIADFKED